MATWVHTRYAIRKSSPNHPGLGTWWHCQGLPATKSFGYAILYNTHEEAEKAMRTWKFRQAIERGGIRAEIIPVECKYEE